uniref:Uncharacterized protein n=1 Tax=Anguilla anguilla TaxID=7936 RepID=A0A0E9UL13_ANGAN
MSRTRFRGRICKASSSPTPRS